MAAPVIMAQGYDAVAQHIGGIARDNGAMLQENVPRAQTRAKEVEVGPPVPTKWHQGAAEALGMLHKLRKKAV